MRFLLAISVLIISFVFIRTSAPTVYIGDSGEMITAAFTLGIGHPPGYPLYMLAAKIFSFLPAGDIAYRVNLMSSFIAVLVFLSMYFTVLYMLRLIFKKKPDLSMKLAGLFAAFIFVFSYMTWFQSLHAKGGAYLMSYLAGLLGVLFCLKYMDEKKPRFFYAAAYVAGFLPAVHYSSGIVMLLILGLLALNMKNLQVKYKITAVCFFLLSFLTSYLYLFIRAKAIPQVCWGDINTARSVFSHIIRKVYFTVRQGPFTADVVFFKLKHYLGQFVYSYKAAVLLSAAGFAFIFYKSRKVFYVMLVFIAANLAGLFYLTGYSYSPFNVYMNSGFYIVVDLALALAAGAGVFGFAGLTDKKRPAIRAAAAAVLLLIPFFNVISFYPANDQSRKFMAYDNTLNDLKTLKTGDHLFAEEDFQVFNILYFKYVRGMFPGINAYDRSANFLDTSIFAGFRAAAMEEKLSVKARNKAELEYMLAQYSQKLERAAEYKVIMRNQGKVYYTGQANFAALNLASRPYGILYKIVREKEKTWDTSALMKLYTIRDYYNNPRLDLYYRDVIARYFVQAAKYAAMNNDSAGFDDYKVQAERTASQSGPVLNLIAEIYYSDLKNMPKAIEYMEKIMYINKYDYAALDVLLRFCLDTDRVKALKWLRHYYEISESNEVKNVILVQIDKLND